MYQSHGEGIIDGPMLNRIFYRVDGLVEHGTKICLIGGTALTALGFRKTGSYDLDIIALNNFHSVVNAFERLKRLVNTGQISIDILKEGKLVKRYVCPKPLVVDVFTRSFSLRDAKQPLKLPSDFIHYIHKIKRFEWVIPEGGEVKALNFSQLYGNMEIYSIGLHDLVCLKIFMPRRKDVKDLVRLLKTIPLTYRFFNLRKRFLLERFLAYVELNKENSDLIYSGIKYYSRFQEKYGYLEPLPPDIYFRYGLKG